MAASRSFTQNRSGHLSAGAPPKTVWAGRIAHGAQIIIRRGGCQGRATFTPAHRASWPFGFAPRCAREACLVRALKNEGHDAPKGATCRVSLSSTPPATAASLKAHRLSARQAHTSLRRLRKPECCGIFGEGTVLPGAGCERQALIHPDGFLHPSPAPVQPLKAEPRSWPGRRPLTSRTDGCEPAARAPHPAPHSRRLMKRPSRTGRCGFNSYCGICQAEGEKNSTRHPREGGDPYALCHRLEKMLEQSSLRCHDAWWLWVPAFAGTTSSSTRQTPYPNCFLKKSVARPHANSAAARSCTDTRCSLTNAWSAS